MTVATARTVVLSTPAEKRAMAAKARALDIPLAELMRRGAAAYDSAREDDLGALADAARAAAERSAAAIDDALAFVAASNQRIAALEAQARRARSKRLRVAR